MRVFMLIAGLCAAALVSSAQFDPAHAQNPANTDIVLRGMGYESNDASILTNVSSDHLDLQGIHTLPELAEVKATVCRITKPDGWVVLNGDDPLVAAHDAELEARADAAVEPDDAAAADDIAEVEA